MKVILRIIFLIFLMSCVPQNSKVVVKNSNVNAKNGIKPFKACKLNELGIAQDLGSPTSIEGVINLINALPRPLDIPCFLSSLNRPLDLNLTSSMNSAQPASGNNNPRIFIMKAPLVISIALSGDGSYLMEFSEFIGNNRSIKGELHFPIESGEVSLSAPFDRINAGNRTSCNGCHRFEVLTNSNYPGVVYESLALRPELSTKVLLGNFMIEQESCNSALSPTYRCNIIFGLLNQGVVNQVEFPTGIPTLYESFRL